LSDTLELGSWGNGFRLVVKQRNVLFISSEEIFEDQYGNPVFQHEINKFMKIKRASIARDGEWIFVIRSQKQLIEIFRKLAKYGYPFAPNPELYFVRKEARDITTATTLLLLQISFPSPREMFFLFYFFRFFVF